MHQLIAWAVTVVLIVFIAIVFIAISARSRYRRDYNPIVEKAYRIRKQYFIVLLIVIILVSIYTLRDLPYERQTTNAAEPPLVVDVVAKQFNWEVSANEATVGQPVEFHVTSADVNHGIGIYDENMNLLGQTQAMPGYTNVLGYTFTKPGTYQFLCMEYCGIGHHIMTSTFVVTDK